MKKVFVLLLSVTLSTYCLSQDITINHNAPIISFEKEVMDLGTFMQYDDPSSKCEFIFTNTGKEPLIISKALSFP